MLVGMHDPRRVAGKHSAVRKDAGLVRSGPVPSASPWVGERFGRLRNAADGGVCVVEKMVDAIAHAPIVADEPDRSSP